MFFNWIIVYWSCLLILELIYYVIFLTISCVCPLIAVCTLCHFMRGLPSFIYCEWPWGFWMSLPSFIDFDSSWGVSRRAILFDSVWQASGVGLRAAGGYPHRFSHNNFSSLYRIFTKLGHMIPPWRVKNPIYFGHRLGMRIAYFVTSCSGRDRFRWRHLRLRMRTRSFPVAPPPQMRFGNHIYTTSSIMIRYFRRYIKYIWINTGHRITDFNGV